MCCPDVRHGMRLSLQGCVRTGRAGVCPEGGRRVLGSGYIIPARGIFLN